MRSRESPSTVLRSALLELSDKTFERYLAAALTELTARPFYVADSGRQDGGDGGAHDALSTVFECKRYDKGSPQLDALLGKFVLASQRIPPPDLWILVATRSISEQRVRTLQREADQKGVGLLILDLPRDRMGDLATLCVLAAQSSAEFIPKAETALLQIRETPGFSVAADRLLKGLDAAQVTLQSLRARAGGWLAEAYADPDLLYGRLGVRPPEGALAAPWSGYVERATTRSAIESWLAGEAPAGRVLCVVGEEGVGKSLACHRALADELDRRLVIAVTRGVELTPDPMDLMARGLRQALGGEAERWRRKLEMILARAESGELPVLLYLDGIDERAGGAWDTLLRHLSDRPFRGRVAVMVSCRPYTLQEHLRDLAFIGGAAKAPVGLFNDVELEAALEARGLRARDFSPEMRDLMRRPRLLGLALKHRVRLEAAGEFTAARLFWEDWDDRIAAGRHIASRPRFRAGLRKLAAALDAERLAVSARALLDAFTPVLAVSADPPYTTLSELVDGGLARLDADHVILDQPFAAVAVGFDLAERLSRLDGPANVLADRARTWLEPWGGAEFEAEVLRAAAWARAFEAPPDDPVLAALAAVWIERKNLPDAHEADVLGVCRRHPGAILTAADIVWRGDDHAAGDRVQAVLRHHVDEPAIRERLVQDARRWICQVGLLTWPFIGRTQDPADYRARRLAEVAALTGGEPVIGRPIELDGEQVTIHDGAGPDGEDAFRRAVTVLRPIGADDLWPAVRAWAIATDFRHHDHLSGLIAGLVRACEAGSPLHHAAHDQLALWAASDEPALMAAARTLSWALGEPEARRIAEPALVRSGFVARREEQLRQIGGYGSPETLEEVREGFRTRNPAHSLRRFGRWLTDPDVDIPASEVAEGLTDLAQLDLEELLKVRSTTRSSLTLEETTAILARYAPKALGDWHRGFANVVAAQADDAVSLARNEIHDAFVLFDADTLRVLTAAKGDDRAVRDLRLAAELAVRDGDAQIEFLLTSPLPNPINADIDQELRAPTEAGLGRLAAALASGTLETHRLVALLYALVATRPEATPEFADQLLALLEHESSAVRFYAMQLLRWWRPVEGAARLKALGWTVEGAADDEEAWRGSQLIARGGEPIDWAIGAAHPAHAVQVAERHPEAARLVAGLLDERFRWLSVDRSVPTPEHLVAMSDGEDLDTRSVETGRLLDAASSSMVDRLQLALTDHERREQIVQDAICQVRAHDELLCKLGGRRPDWRVDTGSLTSLWQADPGAFEGLGRWLEDLDGDNLDEAAYRQPGMLCSLVEAGLTIEPRRFAPIWRRLRLQEARRRYRTTLGADWLHIMPFRLAPDQVPPELLEESLESSRSDAQLMDVAMYAAAHGHDIWLTARIDQDAASATAWRRARALMLDGFLARPVRLLDPYPRLDARASWLSDVASEAEGWRRRRRTLQHWLRRFLEAEDPDEIFATFELAKRNAMRWLRLELRQAELGDAQRRHLMRQEYDLQRKIQEGEKDLADAYLGLKVQPDVWPPRSPHLSASRPPHFGG